MLEQLGSLPGGALVRAGLADLGAGRRTVPAYVVQIAKRRLVNAGLMPEGDGRPVPDAELQLYRLLREEGGDAYSRYNSLLRELVSFENALNQRSTREIARGG